MHILVTGAAGQLGTELHNVLEEKIPGLTLYTDIDSLDLTDEHAVENFIANNEITHIVNCAAFTAVDRAESDAILCNRVNIDAVTNIAMAASRHNAKVIHISTDYVFDGTNHVPYKESDKVNPLSQYGSSKRKSETVLMSLVDDAIVIRTSWLYSPYGNNFVKTMLRLGEERPSLSVVADQVGTPTYALDLAHGILSILTSSKWIPGIFHFSDLGVASWYDFTKMIFRLTGNTKCHVSPTTTENYPTPARRPLYSVLDKTLIRDTYNLEIPYWVDSLEDCLRRIGRLKD